jgi:DNA modification methylase
LNNKVSQGKVIIDLIELHLICHLKRGKRLLNKIYNKDARDILKFLKKDNFISTTITSPPYFDMKDYGCKKQIGFGQTYQQYLDDLHNVFKSIYDLTRDNGTLWIVIDTFKEEGRVVPLPFDLITKLNQIGWLLQDIIIWKKDKTVPWSGNGFVQRKFEYILFFSKTKKFKYFKDRVRTYDTSYLKKWWVKYPERYNPKGKALDEIWEYPIPIQGSWGDKYIRHFCPLPTDMIGNMIQLSTNEKDIVLDPFAGSGSVLVQAAYMKRRYVGFELNKKYIKMFDDYIDKTIEKGRRGYDLFTRDHKDQNNFKNNILNLRSLKFAKVLYKKITEKIPKENIDYVFVEKLKNSQEKHKLIKVKFTIFTKGDKSFLKDIISKLILKPPLSKFGIEPVIIFKKNISALKEKQKIYGYTSTNTYFTVGNVDLKNMKKTIKILSPIKVELNENDYE